MNLDLDQLYVLTGPATASASELTIVGLEPYMDVRTFGETTYGKCYGGYNMTPDMYNPSWTDLTDWKLYLISFMFANADGLTDFTDGLRPDVEVPSVVETVPLGSEEDHLLGTALEAIGGSLRAGQVGLERGIPLGEHVRPTSWGRFARSCVNILLMYCLRIQDIWGRASERWS